MNKSKSILLLSTGFLTLSCFAGCSFSFATDATATSEDTHISVNTSVDDPTTSKPSTSEDSGTSMEDPTTTFVETSESGPKKTLVGWDKKASFATYDAYKAAPSTDIDGYYDQSQIYTVGDDNEFVMTPSVRFMVEGGSTPHTDITELDRAFKITATNKQTGVVAGINTFNVTDAKLCKVKFTQKAVGKTYTIKIEPTGTYTSGVKPLEMDVAVIDGYNVYTAAELGYMDTRAGLASYQDMDVNPNYDNFFTKKGMPTRYADGSRIRPNAVVLHNDISVTDSDIPEELFWTKEELDPLYPADKTTVAKLTGTLKDWATLYMRTKNTNDDTIQPGDADKNAPFVVNGNYFKLNFSQVSLVGRDADEDIVTPVSHANVFYVYDDNFEIKNVNVTGNAPKTADAKYGGGLIFLKASGRSSWVKAYNTLNRKTFISYMTSEPRYGFTPVDTYIEKSKCSDSWNSFLYNWAGNMIIKDSYFNNCGGPIIIQDHNASGNATDYDVDADGVETIGSPANTVFENCVLKNYVNGTEGWFDAFGVTSQVAGIKSLCALYNKLGMTFLYDATDNHLPTLYTTAGSLMNFITINKSSNTVGAGAYHVNGNVTIKYTEGETAKEEQFNYARLTAEQRTEYGNDVTGIMGAITELQTAYETISGGGSVDPNTLLPTIGTLIGYADKYGVSYDGTVIMNYENDMQSALAELVTLATNMGEVVRELSVLLAAHKDVIRQVNKAGGPAMQTGKYFGYYAGGEDLLDPGFNSAAMTSSSAFVKKAGNYTSIYYNGMMLVLGLSKLA